VVQVGERIARLSVRGGHENRIDRVSQNAAAFVDMPGGVLPILPSYHMFRRVTGDALRRPVPKYDTTAMVNLQQAVKETVSNTWIYSTVGLHIKMVARDERGRACKWIALRLAL
jgi:hypothetical protein